jgi:uncharacterized protein
MHLWDSTMLIIIPAVVLAIIAQIRVQTAFKRWSQVPARSGYSGAQAAQALLKQGQVQLGGEGQGLGAVAIRHGIGHLSDHYNPADHTLNLSPEVYEGRSIAALAIAAHETGHAYQHATHYGALVLRGILVPAAVAGQLSWWLFLAGMLVRLPILQNVAIWIFAGATLFTFVTLPVEYNASGRAAAMLQESGIIAADEMPGVRSVLGAAALTYVAAALMAALQLVRMVLLRRD